MNKNLLLLALVLLLTSCGDKDKNKPVVGDSFFEDSLKRYSSHEADALVNKFVSGIPAEISNDSWPRNGFVPGENLKFIRSTEYDSVSVGSSPENGLDITSSPVVAEGMVFTIDGSGSIQARAAGNISKLVWEAKISDGYRKGKNGYLEKVTGIFSGKGDTFIGGNISYGSGTVYVSTKRGYIFALSARDGSIIWSRDIGSPVRSAPVARENTVVFITSDNRTVAVSGKDGKDLWQHQGLASASRVSSSPEPLLIGNKLIVPYSSGELYALDFNDGSELWNVSVATSEYGKLSSSFLSDISYSPIYHNGLIYVVSSDGTLNAIDASGNIVWTFEGKVINHTPWGIGGLLFATTRSGELLAVSAHEGKLVWKKKLADDEKMDEDDLQFTGPVVASGGIYVADNNGTLYEYSLKDGSNVDKISVPSDIYLTPVLVSGRMYLLSRSATLAEIK